MARGNCTLRQSDLTKALKAHRDAGLPVARSEIDPRTGKIIIVVGPPAGGEISPPEHENDFGG